MGEKIILILTVIFAYLAVQSEKLTRAVIYLGVFSFLCSILYLLYRSPNIAIAEAVIGSTLSTVIYLVALRKQKRFTVFVFDEISYDLLDYIEAFCEMEDLVFHYLRYTHDAFDKIVTSEDYDVIIDGSEEEIVFVSKGKNYKIEKLASTLAKEERFDYNVSLHEMRDPSEMENV